MKRFIHLLTGFFLLQRFQVYALMLLLVFSLSSCFQKFYNTNTVSRTDPATLQKFQMEKKLFIVHTPDGPFALSNVIVDKEMISGDKGTLDPQFEKYLMPKSEGTNRLQMSKSGTVLNEVHLYTNSEFNGNGKVNLGINDIFRMDAYSFDKAATKKSRVISIVALTAIPVAAITTVALMASNWGSGPIILNIHD